MMKETDGGPSLPAELHHLARILLCARLIAGRNGVDEIRPEEMVLAILEEASIESSEKSAVQALGLPASTYDKLRRAIQGSNAPQSIRHGDLPLATASISLIAGAARVAQSRQEKLSGLHLLLVLLSNESPLRFELSTVGLNPEKVEYALQQHYSR